MERIILVEDDHDLRASLCDCLEEAGFMVAWPTAPSNSSVS